jgi:hypothetical protein
VEVRAMNRPPDFMDMWRDALQKWERQTNEVLNNVTADEGVSRIMNQSLAAVTRLQAQQGEAIERLLVRSNLPSRADFRVLGERLDGIEAQLAELKRLLQKGGASTDAGKATEAAAATTTPRPARTRKPPQAGA